MADNIVRKVDVLIVGAGPVGLITALQLAKFGSVSVAIIEKNAKTVQDAYGRAITLFPRTSEMLDQLGLAEDLAQQCFACRDTATYSSKGEEIQGRGWSFMQTSMHDTAWDFALVLRQKYQEDVFRRALKRHGVEVEAPMSLTALEVDESIPVLQHRIFATVVDGDTGHEISIKCKFVIGCDGGKSTVRKLMRIPFQGTSTEDKWVRIDGLVETNLPKPRTYCSIESPTHGNVLWVGLDRGRIRIGYAFTDARANPYGTFDEAAAVKEAMAAVKPFDVSFKTVDWWTIYSVGQRIAERFLVKDCVFMAGDACHTHSSGAAQGMNTGIHDSVNLAWKLSLVLRGVAKPEILRTYEAERLPNVRQLIKYDEDISQLMTNRLPNSWTGSPDVDLNALLGDVMAEAASFSSGLGISYEPSSDNPLSREEHLATLDQLRPGQRAPDVGLLKPGSFERTRLIIQTPNVARFYCLVFVKKSTIAGARSFVRQVQESSTGNAFQDSGIMEFITILPVASSSPYDVLGCEPLGRVYFEDQEQSASRRYGVQDTGACCLVRPDGWLGATLPLRDGTVGELEAYFDAILR